MCSFRAGLQQGGSVHEYVRWRDVDCVATAHSQPHRQALYLLHVHANPQHSPLTRWQFSQREAVRIGMSGSALPAPTPGHPHTALYMPASPARLQPSTFSATPTDPPIRPDPGGHPDGHGQRVGSQTLQACLLVIGDGVWTRRCTCYLLCACKLVDSYLLFAKCATSSIS